MNKDDDPIAAFGSIEEGDEPLQPYIDPALFDTLDRQAQIEILTPVFDAITLAGVDYDLQVQQTPDGKRYSLLKNDEVVKVLVMDSEFTDQVIDALKGDEEDSWLG